MLTTAVATKHVKQFASLPGYPRDIPEAVSALAETLCGAGDEEHARRAVAQLLYGAERCPTPADIRRAIQATKLPERVMTCGKCVDGWRFVAELRTLARGHWTRERVDIETVPGLRASLQGRYEVGDHSQVLYEGVVPCECRR